MIVLLKRIQRPPPGLGYLNIQRRFQRGYRLLVEEVTPEGVEVGVFVSHLDLGI